MKRTALAFFITLTAVANVATAAAPTAKVVEPQSSYVIVFDLMNADPEADADRQRVFAFSIKGNEKVFDRIGMEPIWRKTDDEGALGARMSALSGTNRFLGTKGDHIAIFAYVDKQTEQLLLRMKTTEANRLARLSKDIVTLLRLASAIEGSKAEVPQPFYIWEGTYRLQRTRADLTVAPHFIDPPKTNDDPASLTEAQKKREKQMTDDAAAAKARNAELPSAKITTGPREAIFLSADVPLTKASQAELNEGGTDLQLNGKPSTFYAGVNYTFGYAISEPSGFWRRVVLKGMVSGSKRPWDSYGWAVAFRSIDIPALGISLDALTPFVGYTYTRLTDKDGHPKGRDSQLRFGVSLNLDSALGWIKKDEAK